MAFNAEATNFHRENGEFGLKKANIDGHSADFVGGTGRA